jgi:hypothetical protein
MAQAPRSSDDRMLTTVHCAGEPQRFTIAHSSLPHRGSIGNRPADSV